MKVKNLAACVLVCLLVATGSAYAQGVGTSGDIRGSVTDPSGAVLPQAKVTATSVEKGIQRASTTDGKGEYRTTGLLPGPYDVSVELRGFQTQVRKGVVVTVGQTVVVDFGLKVSTVATEVVVTGETPLVDTEKASQSDTVEEQYIRNLPIDRRDYLTYTLLMPGVTDSRTLADNTDFRVKQTPQSGLSFYGSNGRGNSVTVDGGEANDDAGGVLLTLSQDAVQEFQINRSNYSAELGSASGASINIVSKSGTKEIHGSAYAFFRNQSLDARDPFAFTSALKDAVNFTDFSLTAKGTPVKPGLNRQQFGGTIGFPIQKDKTFLFLAYEGLRRDEQAPVPLLTDSSIFAPTPAQQAILAGLPPGPAACLRSVLTIDPTTPAPSVCPKTFPATATEPFIVKLFITNSGVFPFTATQDLGSARLDHVFNANNQVFLRYNYARDIEQNPNLQALVGFSQGNQVSFPTSSTIEGAWYHQFSPQTQNEARAQFIYYKFNVIPNDPGGPQLEINGFGSFGRNIFLPSLTIARRNEFADNFTFIRGRHKMKTGAYLLLRGNHTNSHTFFPGRFFFGDLPGGLISPALARTTITSLQALKLGLPQFYQQGFGSGLIPATNPLIAGYWQDSWSLRSNLTLNYGLRYELDKRYTPLHTDTDNFAPRVSLSWDPFGNHKTVVRAGYGIFYSPIYLQIDSVVRYLGVVDRTKGNQQVRDLSTCASGTVDCFRQIAIVLVPLTGAPFNPLLTSATIFRTLFAQRKIGCGTPPGGAEACITQDDLTQFGIPITHTGPIPFLSLPVIFSGEPDYQNAYSQQAGFGIERELGRGFSISLSYIHSRTLKVTRAHDKNILSCPRTCSFVNPLLLQDNVYESSGKAFYDGAIIEVNKRFSQHFSLFANYTFSKAIDDVTDFNSDFQANDQTNLAAERSLSPFDQRHKVVIAAVLESPWKGGRDPSLAARILSGFTLSPIVRGNSGRPFNLLVGADINGDHHSTTDRPPGAGRDTGLGPNFWTFDLRLARRFALGEKANVQLMAEGFNILNRTNFATVNNTVGVIGPPFNLSGRRDRTPSQPLGFTAAQPMRQIQLGLRLAF